MKIKMNEFFSKEFYGNTVGQWLTALLVILAAVIIGRLVYWFFTKIVRIFTKKTKSKLDDIIIDKIEEPIVLAMVIIGIWYGIGFLTVTTQVAKQIEGFIYLLIILDVAWLIVRTVDGLVDEYITPFVEKSESSLDDAILPIARRGFSIVIWVVAVVVGLNNAGYDVATILAGLGIGGLALAIGARTAIMNIFGGLTVLITQPFKIGDRILINEYDGHVEFIGLSVTRLKRFIDNHIVTIPNRVFADQEIVNITAANGIKADFLMNLPIDIDPKQVEEMLDFLKDLALTHPHLHNETKTSIQGANDFALVIHFIYYVRPGSPFWDVKSEVGLAIIKQLKYKNISLATRNQLNYLPENSSNERKNMPKLKIQRVLENDEDLLQ